MIKKIMKFIWDNFAAGIVAILPISITILIIRFLVIKVNSFMLVPLLNALDPNILREEQRLILAKSTVFLSVIFLPPALEKPICNNIL